MPFRCQKVCRTSPCEGASGEIIYKKPDSNKVYLITSAAGFIGYYLSRNLLDKGCRVIGIDNMNDYYDVRLKEKRLELLSDYDGFTFLRVDIADKKALDDVFEKYQPEIVVNLAAQAGGRYSIINPEQLMYFIGTLEKELSKATGREIVAKKEFLPMQPGDVYATFADTEPLEKVFGFKPSTSIEDGLQKFADWYCDYYDVK